MNNNFSPGPRHPGTAEYHEFQVPYSIPSDDWEADSHSQERGETPYEDKQERLLHQPSPPSFGKPTRMKKIDLSDVLIMLLSMLCLVIAIVTVANESISWRLGVGNRQLIVLGFLLSIMNLCLGSLAPNSLLTLRGKIRPVYDPELRRHPSQSTCCLLN